jgi:ribosomal protein S18 acetylase RimI-like enzyme
MDCLNLDPDVRDQEIGQRLVETRNTRARQEGHSIMQWQTPPFNANAIEFYKHLGSRSSAKVRFYPTIANTRRSPEQTS